MAKGYLSLVLHAHLPFIRHPEHDNFLEESWFFEAITDTYLPLLRVFDGLVADGAKFRVTVSLSPPLMAMLSDPFLQERYYGHLARMAELGDKEIIRRHGDRRLSETARLHRGLIYRADDDLRNKHGGDIIAAFGRLQDAGVLELATAGATHGFLPILKTQPTCARAQLRVAADVYQKAFGRTVPGFWLPECGYYPGVESYVAETGARFFFSETHGIGHARPTPRNGYLAPLACPNGVSVFARDPASSRQVWSQDAGYPGDPWYRDFYRDVGFDLDLDYIRPYLLDENTRTFTGYKYYRITGNTDQKEPYEPDKARDRAAAHAEDFVRRLTESVEANAPRMDRPPAIVALYDAELFGHWWFEGPQWLDFLLRKLAFDQDTIETVTPSDYLARHPDVDTGIPSASSWGDKGYSDFWLNPGNDWIYRHLHAAGGRMTALATQHQDSARGGLRERALNQAARSLLLAQASDWAFIMRTGTAVDYADGRTRDYLARFHAIADAVEGHSVDEHQLVALETMDNIFPDIDFRVYAH
jgi:1,4-alpha-glucan branching enzyme